MFVVIEKFVMWVRGGHFNFSPWASRNLVTSLLSPTLLPKNRCHLAEDTKQESTLVKPDNFRNIFVILVTRAFSGSLCD
jgi:hypothetical protein